MEKIINHVGIAASKILKRRETTAGKLLLHKYKYSLGRECIWNYRADVGILSYINVLKKTRYIHGRTPV